MGRRCLHDYKNAIQVGKVDYACPLCKELLDPMEWFFMNQFEFVDVGNRRCKIERMDIPDKGQIKIRLRDLRTILGEDFRLFRTETVPNCWCYKCNVKKGRSKIVNFLVFLNDVNDVVLRGFCAVCGSRIDRYVEIGEVEKYEKAISKIRKDLENRLGRSIVTKSNFIIAHA